MSMPDDEAAAGPTLSSMAPSPSMPIDRALSDEGRSEGTDDDCEVEVTSSREVDTDTLPLDRADSMPLDLDRAEGAGATTSEPSASGTPARRVPFRARPRLWWLSPPPGHFARRTSTAARPSTSGAAAASPAWTPVVTNSAASAPRVRFRDRQRGWWMQSLRDNYRAGVTGGTPNVSAENKDGMGQLDPSPPARQRPRSRRARGFVPLLVIVLIALVAFAIANGTGASSTSVPAPTPVPTTVASMLTLNAPLLSSCRAENGTATTASHTKIHIFLDTLPYICGHVNLAAVSHATWRNLTLRRGLQFTGKNSGVVFALNGRYSVLAGVIYLDNATGTKGGTFDLYAATAPGNTETYRPLHEIDIGSAPENRATFSVRVSGVRYLAVVERCCTVQNTILDVVATLTAVQ